MDILLISARPETWASCEPIFQSGNYALQKVASLEDGLQHIRATPPRLVILDPQPDTDIRAAIIEILKINAAVHTAVVSRLEEEAFHEAMEGLGILMPLPPSPGPADAQLLLTTLSAMP